MGDFAEPFWLLNITATLKAVGAADEMQGPDTDCHSSDTMLMYQRCGAAAKL